MGFPPGARNDSRAPYNHTTRNENDSVDGIVMDENENEYAVRIKMVYERDPEEGLFIKTYEHRRVDYKTPSPGFDSIPEDILDEQIRDIIRDHFNERIIIFQ